jgi:polyhydroxybutyrate depolymerase
MIYRRTSLLLLAVALLVSCRSTPWTGSVTAPGHYYLEFEHAGLVRSYELRIPASYTGATPVPLHFDIHPLTANAWIMDLMTDFRSDAERDGFILVQPNGIERSWNSGPKCCAPANDEGLDDVGMIRTIRDELVAMGLNIDPARIFLDGMSNGGYLSNRIACEHPEFTAGIASVVGSMGYASVEECQPSEPVAVLMISGGDDYVESRNETFGRWLELNQCSASTKESFGVFTCETYNDCAGGVETTHCIGEGVGHCWPGTDFLLRGCDSDLDASQYILDFFARVRR